MSTLLIFVVLCLALPLLLFVALGLILALARESGLWVVDRIKDRWRRSAR